MSLFATSAAIEQIMHDYHPRQRNARGLALHPIFAEQDQKLQRGMIDPVTQKWVDYTKEQWDADRKAVLEPFRANEERIYQLAMRAERPLYQKILEDLIVRILMMIWAVFWFLCLTIWTPLHSLVCFMLPWLFILLALLPIIPRFILKVEKALLLKTGWYPTLMINLYVTWSCFTVTFCFLFEKQLGQGVPPLQIILGGPPSDNFISLCTIAFILLMIFLILTVTMAIPPRVQEWQARQRGEPYPEPYQPQSFPEERNRGYAVCEDWIQRREEQTRPRHRPLELDPMGNIKPCSYRQFS